MNCKVFFNCKIWAGAMRSKVTIPALEEPNHYHCFLAKQTREGHTIFPEKI